MKLIIEMFLNSPFPCCIIEKRGWLVFILFVVVLMSFSFISAGLFGDLWNKITGQPVKSIDSSSSLSGIEDGSEGLESNITFDSYYLVSLISASDSSATIKVLDSLGNFETKEIQENGSENINNLGVFLYAADETPFYLNVWTGFDFVLSSYDRPFVVLNLEEENGTIDDYIFELISASDTSATIKVISNSMSETKEIIEGQTKTVNGVEVTINLADENSVTGVMSADIDVKEFILQIDVSEDVGCDEYYLQSSSQKLYIGDSINKVRQTLTDAELPMLLEDGTFVGNVVADYVQNIYIDSNKIMSSNFSNNSVYIDMGTFAADPLYNVGFTFDQFVDFTHSDSIGEFTTLLGREFMIGVETNVNELYLYETAERLTLSLGGNNSNAQATVLVDGDFYTVELIGGDDTSSVVKVIEGNGSSQTKEISEHSSKVIQGLGVTVLVSDENSAMGVIYAALSLGGDVLKLSYGESIKRGYDEIPVGGTYVGGSFGYNSSWSNWADSAGFGIYIFAPINLTDNRIYEGEIFSDYIFTENLGLIFESYNSIDGAMIYFEGCLNKKICGDVDGDGQDPNVADLSYLIDYLWKGGPEPPNMWSANVDGNNGVNVADLSYFVDYLFKGGSALNCQYA